MSLAFISGRHQVCADPRCDNRVAGVKVSLVLDWETYDGIDRCVVGGEHCPVCGCSMIFTRKLTKAEIAGGLRYHNEVLFKRDPPSERARPLEATHEVEWP